MNLMGNLARAILEAPRAATPEILRRQVFEYSSALAVSRDATAASLPEAVANVTRQIATEAYRLTDEQVDKLREAGFSEDAIFELFVAASVAAGVKRAAIGLAALKEARNAP